MKQIYMLRHQSLGFLTNLVFAQEPTEAQIAEVLTLLPCGSTHPKTGEPYFCVAVAIPLEGDATDLDSYVPPPPAAPASNKPGPGEMTFGGTGYVKNPE